jgi:hypothetical protein
VAGRPVPAVACQRRSADTRSDLRSVDWPTTWRGGAPVQPLSLAETHLAMQLHREHGCARRHAAFARWSRPGASRPIRRAHRFREDLMTDSERHLPETECLSLRLHQLTARAGRAGYRLLRGGSVPYIWELVDADDGAPITAAIDLDQIEQWLDS